MRAAYDAATVRAAEQPLLEAQPDGTLMARAAAGLARVCAQVLGGAYGARVLLLVGAGNNGGDVLHAGALLARRGARVEALLLADRVHEAGLAALRRAGGRVVVEDGYGDVGDIDLVLDGILGIGGRGGLRGRAAEVAAALPDGALVVAADVPSGVDASTGEVAGAAVRADVTVTFGAVKTGLLVDPGAGHAGVVELVDIGLDLPPAAVEVLQTEDVAALLPRADRESDKYRRGVVGVAAGSAQYTGAAVLCVGGALRGGAGMVRYLGADEPAALVRARWPEVVVGEGRVQAWTVGSGAGDDAAATAGPGAGRRRPDRGGRRRAPGRGAAGAAGRCRCCSRRTPASWPGWSVPTATTSRPGGCTTPRRRRRSSARSCCSRGPPRWSPTRTDGSGSTRPAPPHWPRPAPVTSWPACAAPCWPAGWTRSTPARSAPGCTGWPAGWPRPEVPRWPPVTCWPRSRTPSGGS